MGSLDSAVLGVDMRYSEQRRYRDKSFSLPENHPSVGSTFDHIFKFFSEGRIQTIATAIEDMDGMIHCMWSGDDSILKRLGLVKILEHNIYQLDCVGEGEE